MKVKYLFEVQNADEFVMSCQLYNDCFLITTNKRVIFVELN